MHAADERAGPDLADSLGTIQSYVVLCIQLGEIQFLGDIVVVQTTKQEVYEMR